MPIPVLDAIPDPRVLAMPGPADLLHARQREADAAEVAMFAIQRRDAVVGSIGALAIFAFMASIQPAYATTAGLSDRAFITLIAGTFALVCIILTMIVAALCDTSDDPCPHQDETGEAEAAAIRQREG